MKILALIIGMASVPATAGDGGSGIQAKPLTISQEGYNLILKHEVGGGASYYSRYLSRPTWPGGASGVTIGVGYDLGYNSRSQIAADWKGLPPEVVARLQSAAGVKGQAARRLAPSLRSISVPWVVAERVYQAKTIPRFAALTEKAYPGTASTNPHIQGAMLSWVFNRGEGISPTASRDIEKRAIRADIPRKVERLPAHFRASKRLWVGKGLDGLLRRREDEARLIELATTQRK